MKFATSIALVPFALIGACSTVLTPPSPNIAPIVNASGAKIGQVSWWDDGNATSLDIRLTGITPGPHGVHLHMTGRCDAPGFTTAGGHWNPTDRQHGHQNAGGWHLGDLGNLNIRSNGSEETVLKLPAGTRFADVDGTALVIHAGADDEMTDPSGNSGGRIACAVIAPAR